MKNYDTFYKKMLLYCMMFLCSFALSCDDDDDDVDIILDDEVEFEDIQLLGANEVPAVTSSGSGTLNATYNMDTKVITYSVTWTLGDVGDDVVGMHFHGPASTTEVAPIIIEITPPATNRDYIGSVSGTTRALTDDEEDDLLAGLWYVNIHSNTYPDGELRGQVED